MADYLAARAAIASIIGAVTITVPATVRIEQVYPYWPDARAVDKFPSVVITGFQLRYQRFPGGVRERLYTLGLRLLVRPVPSGSAPMGDILDALKNAISEVFDTSITLDLGGGYSVVEGPNWTSLEPRIEVAGIVSDDAEIILQISDGATFSG